MHASFVGSYSCFSTTAAYHLQHLQLPCAARENKNTKTTHSGAVVTTRKKRTKNKNKNKTRTKKKKKTKKKKQLNPHYRCAQRPNRN